MNSVPLFHFLTVGTSAELMRNLWDPVAAGSKFGFSHLVHPTVDLNSLRSAGSGSVKYSFFGPGRLSLPEPDKSFLGSLECADVPTVHNMILSDRVIAALPYDEALAYATLVARRMVEVFERLRPDAVIGGFDAIHGSLGLAVARKLGIPWYALHFSVIPEGLACFCDQLSPASRVLVDDAPVSQAETWAAKSLQSFEAREIAAPAYIAATPRSMAETLNRIPGRLSRLVQMLRSRPAQGVFRYSESSGRYSVASALRIARRAAHARKAVAKRALLSLPPPYPYVLFGLHMQPESSIDVWAPFFSNQMWVIELLSRSIPPTRKLLVKIHKSDTAHYSDQELRKIRSFPGVELVAPFADTRRFIENADLIVLIQGTMGLEAALLGKSVIMLGRSPFALFPSVAQAGAISDLPALIRTKLEERRPSRAIILKAYAQYLRPFAPASANDWAAVLSASVVNDYRCLFDRLRKHILGQTVARTSGSHPADLRNSHDAR